MYVIIALWVLAIEPVGVPPSFQVGLLSLMANTLAEKNEGFQALHLQICSVLSQVLPPMKELATVSPYAFNNKPVVLPKPVQMTRQDSTDSAIPQTPTKSSRRVKKRRSEQAAKAPPKVLFPKKRSNSISTLALTDVKFTLPSPRARAMTRSISPQSSLHVASTGNSDRFVLPTQGSTDSFALSFQLPSEVLILPVVEADPGKGNGTGERTEGDGRNIQWDFDLLSEEEVGIVIPGLGALAFFTLGNSSKSPLCIRVHPHVVQVSP